MFPKYSLTSNYPCVGAIHDQGANMLLLDGHVEWARWWQWTAQDDTAARRWNYDDQPHEELW
jgi:prepilin-type processing-associated H-X9-DG protein